MQNAAVPVDDEARAENDIQKIMEGRANLFAELWAESESRGPKPERVREVVVMPSAEFADRVVRGDRAAAEALVASLHAGDGYVLKAAFDTDFWRELKRRAAAYAESREPSFAKILEGATDFHRFVGVDVSGKYAARRVRHDFHFYPWNDDPLAMRAACDERWRVFKVLSGIAPDAFAANTPKDGVIDRYHVFHYPRGGGQIQTHSDPTRHQKTIMISLGSKRGVDYQSGGLYMVRPDGSRLDCEPFIDPGDMVTCYANVHHGVATVDEGMELDWSPEKGRWFLGFYSIDSDEVAERQTIVGIEDEATVRA